MKEQNVNHFCPKEKLRSLASGLAIANTETDLGINLPHGYVKFFMMSNGYEGFVGKNSYLVLWHVEKLKQFQKGYQVNQYVPGLLMIGSDGGGEAYGFDTRLETWTVVQVPFIGMDWSMAQLISASFEDFIEYLYKS